MKVGLRNRKRWRQAQSQCGFDRKTWGINRTHERALFSCPHREILEPTEFRNKIRLKTWLLFVNQTWVKSVTWWNRVSHLVVTQINIITTEHSMLVVQDRVSRSCFICTMKPRMTLKFWSFCCHLLSTGDRCVPAHPVYVVLGMDLCVLNNYSMGWSTVQAELLLFFLILWKHPHFSSVFPYWVQCHGKTKELIMNSLVSQLDSSQQFLPKHTRVTILAPPLDR